MKCFNCDSEKKLKRSKITYKYKDCGLDNVTLLDAEIMKCDECGEEYYSFGDIEKLHRKIADILIMKEDLLLGKEIRFLRKHLGYSGILFATLIGYAHETLSRIENGNQEVTPVLDRLIRFIVANKLSNRSYDLHDLYLNHKGEKIKNIRLKKKTDGSWERMVA